MGKLELPVILLLLATFILFSYVAQDTLTYTEHTPEFSLPHTSRVYSTVNEERKPEFWNFPMFTKHISTSTSRYKLGSVLGKGYSASVYSALQDGSTRVAVKVMNQNVSVDGIVHQMRINEALQGATKVVLATDFIKTPTATWMVYQYAPSVDIIEAGISEAQFRQCFYDLVDALDQIHSRGLIHRDVKYQNMVFDPITHRARLIDLGSAYFYRPGHAIALDFGLKAPEFYFKYQYYDYSTDLWSLALALGRAATGERIIGGEHTGFKNYGTDDYLVSMTDYIGTDGLVEFVEKYNFTLSDELYARIGDHGPKTHTPKKGGEAMTKYATPEFFDIIQSILRYDPLERPTARELMSHSYFTDVIRD